MSLIVYGTSRSRALRVLWMAEELGIEFEHRPINFTTDTKTPEFLSINPNGRVPTLITESGEVLWESMAINLYLAKHYGGELAPSDAWQEALAVQWSFWVMTELEKNLLEVLFSTLGILGQEVDLERAASFAELLKRPLEVLESALSERQWLVSDGFSVADLNVASVLTFSKMAKVDLSPFPEVSKWLDTCLSRPALQRARERS